MASANFLPKHNEEGAPLLPNTSEEETSIFSDQKPLRMKDLGEKMETEKEKYKKDADSLSEKQKALDKNYNQLCSYAKQQMELKKMLFAERCDAIKQYGLGVKTEIPDMIELEKVDDKMVELEKDLVNGTVKKPNLYYKLTKNIHVGNLAICSLFWLVVYYLVLNQKLENF